MPDTKPLQPTLSALQDDIAAYYQAKESYTDLLLQSLPDDPTPQNPDKQPAPDTAPSATSTLSDWGGSSDDVRVKASSLMDQLLADLERAKVSPPVEPQQQQQSSGKTRSGGKKK